jgi:hypothetical protein
VEEAPDLLLHGLSRYSLGIPGVPFLNMLADQPFLPSIDMSGRFSQGRVIPGIETLTNTMKGTGEKTGEKGLAQLVFETLGPVGSMFGSLADIGIAAGSGNAEALWKKTEQGLPKAAGALVKAVRAGFEGTIDDYSGARIAEFDWANPAEFIELANMGLGGQPTRLRQSQYAQWAKKELMNYWSMRYSNLLDQYWSMLSHDERDQNAYADWLRDVQMYNANAPVGAALTSDAIRKSMKMRARNMSVQEGGFVGAKKYWMGQKEVGDLFPQVERVK